MSQSKCVRVTRKRCVHHIPVIKLQRVSKKLIDRGKRDWCTNYTLAHLMLYTTHKIPSPLRV